jgi:tRNA G18 (ribose-2'-O)-methylase SpoU
MPTVHLVAINVRSVLNVGSLFRTADAFGIEKIWITGYTPTPNHPRMKKTSLGAEATVPWERVVDPIECLDRLRASGIRVYGLELAEDASDLALIAPDGPCAIVVGNEVDGLSKMQMDHCDEIVMITQVGTKESLNVAVAGSIAMWQLTKGE